MDIAVETTGEPEAGSFFDCRDGLGNNAELSAAAVAAIDAGKLLDMSMKDKGAVNGSLREVTSSPKLLFGFKARKADGSIPYRSVVDSNISRAISVGLSIVTINNSIKTSDVKMNKTYSM